MSCCILTKVHVIAFFLLKCHFKHFIDFTYSRSTSSVRCVHWHGEELKMTDWELMGKLTWKVLFSGLWSLVSGLCSSDVVWDLWRFWTGAAVVNTWSQVRHTHCYFCVSCCLVNITEAPCSESQSDVPDGEPRETNETESVFMIPVGWSITLIISCIDMWVRSLSGDCLLCSRL